MNKLERGEGKERKKKRKKGGEINLELVVKVFSQEISSSERILFIVNKL